MILQYILNLDQTSSGYSWVYWKCLWLILKCGKPGIFNFKSNKWFIFLRLPTVTVIMTVSPSILFFLSKQMQQRWCETEFLELICETLSDPSPCNGHTKLFQISILSLSTLTFRKFKSINQYLELLGQVWKFLAFPCPLRLCGSRWVRWGGEKCASHCS